MSWAELQWNDTSVPSHKVLLNWTKKSIVYNQDDKNSCMTVN